ncbi:MAG TPA: hypothetical protein VHP14_22070, partial [Anaerolineales bacterium]|nr:hypothetical protein [Anaerolineales bacterium]
MRKINKALQQQLDRNQTKNMLYARLGQILEIDPDFLAALEKLLASDSKSFSEPARREAASFAAETLIKRLYAINQFVQVNEQKKHELEDIYLHTWQQIIETKNIQATLLNRHYPELTNWIASLYPQSFRKHLRDVPTVGQVVCEEYSPLLQIDLLKLDVQTLKQPVLDLGCGSKAGLTRHLRALGMEA